MPFRWSITDPKPQEPEPPNPISLSEPCFLSRWSQQTVFSLQESSSATKAISVAGIALISLALVGTSLLNHFQYIQYFNVTTQWSILGGGAFIAGNLIAAIAIYSCSIKYYRNAVDLPEKYQFLLERPKWYARQSVYGGGEDLRSSDRYHEWYNFPFYPKGMLTDVAAFEARPDIEVHWKGAKQIVYQFLGEEQYKLPRSAYKNDAPKFTNDGRESKIIYQVTLPQKPGRCHFPYLKEDTLFVEEYQDNKPIIIALDIKTGDRRSIFEVNKGEVISLIRCCEDILVIGHESGLVQLRDLTGHLISSYKTQSEILDAWIDPAKRTLETYSNHTYSLDGSRRRKKEIWQF